MLWKEWLWSSWLLIIIIFLIWRRKHCWFQCLKILINFSTYLEETSYIYKISTQKLKPFLVTNILCIPFSHVLFLEGSICFSCQTIFKENRCSVELFHTTVVACLHCWAVYTWINKFSYMMWLPSHNLINSLTFTDSVNSLSNQLTVPSHFLYYFYNNGYCSSELSNSIPPPPWKEAGLIRL